MVAPRRTKGADGGFTLIELLVVVVILGILIAIAIPVYLNYRKSAYDKAAQSDLRGTVSVLELCLSDNAVYPANASFNAGASAGTNGIICTNRRIPVSTQTTMTYFTNSDRSGYIIGSSAGSSGTGATYCFNSVVSGAIITTSSAVTSYRATCGS